MTYTSKSSGRTYIGERSESQARANDLGSGGSSLTGNAAPGLTGKEGGLVDGRQPFSKEPPARMDSGLVGNLAGLLAGNAEKKTATLPAVAARGALPGGAGVAADPSVTKGGSGGGVSSPVTEGTGVSPSSLQRTYWTPHSIQAMDGIMTFEYVCLKQIKLVDSAGTELVFNFSDDPPEE